MRAFAARRPWRARFPARFLVPARERVIFSPSRCGVVSRPHLRDRPRVARERAERQGNDDIAVESFTHATRSRWEDARKRRRVFGYRSTRLRGSRTKENSSHRSTPPMDPRMNRASSPPNAPRLTIVNHCRVAALSPSTRRLADATVRLLVLVRKSDDVTRKYVHRARARVFTRTPLRSRSRSSTFALDSACAVCASHTREKKKKTLEHE